jgi:hypothetical protein
MWLKHVRFCAVGWSRKHTLTEDIKWYYDSYLKAGLGESFCSPLCNCVFLYIHAYAHIHTHDFLPQGEPFYILCIHTQPQSHGSCLSKNICDK